MEYAGAHVKGHNANNIGICVIGGVNEHGEPENTFTLHQWHTLEVTISY